MATITRVSEKGIETSAKRVEDKQQSKVSIDEYLQELSQELSKISKGVERIPDPKFVRTGIQQKKITEPKDDYDHVELVQMANASFIRELNRYNTQFV